MIGGVAVVLLELTIAFDHLPYVLVAVDEQDRIDGMSIT